MPRHQYSSNETSCFIRGRHLSARQDLFPLQDKLASDRLAATVINLSSLDGSTTFCVTPSWIQSPLMQAIDRLDSKYLWRDWINRSFGAPLSFSNNLAHVDACEPPSLYLSRALMSRVTTSIGVNLGGYYARLVYVSDPYSIQYGPEIKIGTADDSIFEGVSPDQFCGIISKWISNTGWHYSSVGIALAAPRVGRHIVSTANLFKPCPEVANSLLSGALESALASRLKCKIGFYNDGECNATADWFSSVATSQSVYSVKLGTSLACGLVTNDRLCLLPLELAKCVITVPSRKRFSETVHPVIGIRGTLREALGAGPVSIRYHRSPSSATNFPQFQLDALAGNQSAQAEAQEMASALVKGMTILARHFGPMPLRIGGKSVEGLFGQFFIGLLKATIAQQSSGCPEMEVSLTSWPATYSAAVGAALLAGAESLNVEREKQ